MSRIITPENQHFFVDRETIRKALAELEAMTEPILEPTMTPREVQEYMRVTLGIRPEDNMASCGIIAARDEE